LETHLTAARSIFERLTFLVLVASASLFAQPLNVGFGLLARGVNLLTDLSDALVFARGLDVDNETLFI
jgi:hypothetical protein